MRFVALRPGAKGPLRYDPRHVLEQRAIPEPNSGCWLWMGKLAPNGYPLISAGMKGSILAHRLALQLASGTEGNGLRACHRCDNPACVNPEHLFWGTDTDNMRDSFRKGRHANARKTHCKRGHQFTADNTIVRPTKTGISRTCRQCLRIWRGKA